VALLETDNRLPGDQNAAVQADELLAKLLFEMGQRLVKQVFPITGTRVTYFRSALR
jgi:hypothetical protein